MSSGTPLQQAVALLRQGRAGEAERELRRLQAARPADPQVAHYLGMLLLQSGRAAEAVAVLSAASQRAWQGEMLLAAAARAAGDAAGAHAAVERVLQQQPAHRPALLMRAELLSRLHRHEEAVRCASALVDATPEDPEPRVVLGLVLLARGAHGDAAAVFGQAVRLRPEDAALQYNLGLALERAGELADAQAAFEAAAQRAPARAAPWSRAAAVAARGADFDGEARAVAGLERALGAGTVDPTDIVEPLLASFLPLGADARRLIVRRQAAAAAGEAARLGAPPRAVRAPGQRPLRVGYLSADFGAHAVGALAEPVIAAHDPARVDVRLYALREREDEVAARYRRHSGYVALAGLPPAAQLARIAQDGPDVLVDLGGYTEGAQPGIVAARPAPLQIAWLGYIGSMGAPFIDYQIVDAAVAPPQLRADWTEHLLRLPGSLLPLSPPLPDVDALYEGRDALRGRHELPPGFLYACFNQAYKIDRDVLAAWIEILADRHDAHLVLAPATEAYDALRTHWRALGGDPARLLFVERIAPDQHLQRAACCDLFLDTFRYHAGATAVSAVRAGLPVLCRPGTTAAARMGVGLAHTLGVPELVADTREAYIATARALATDASARTALRRRMLEHLRGPAGDPRAFAGRLERAYAEVMARQRAGAEATDLELE